MEWQLHVKVRNNSFEYLFFERKWKGQQRRKTSLNSKQKSPLPFIFGDYCEQKCKNDVHVRMLACEVTDKEVS